jgi:peroxiredoxin
MKTMMPRSFVAARAMIGVVLAVAAITGYFGIQYRNNRVPDNVVFSTLENKQIALETLKGMPVLVAFWATDCRICLRELDGLSALYREFEGSGLHILAVAMSYDMPSQVVAVRNAKQLPFSVVYDQFGALAKVFHDVQGVPDSFLIGSRGELIQHWTGMPDFEQIRSRIRKIIEERRSNVA